MKGQENMVANTLEAKAQELVGHLDLGQLAAVVHLLEVMISPEEESDTASTAELQAIAEADQWLQHNQPIPHEQVLAEFGLTMEDWEKMADEPVPEEAPRPRG
jgi:hypothetical protein